MARTLRALRAATLPLLVAVVAACASTPDTADTDQMLVRVQNDIDRTYVTVSMEDMDGSAEPLGNVDGGSTHSFVFEIPDDDDRYRLIAVPAGAESRDDYVISEPFTLEEGATVSWFLEANELEIS